MLSASTIQSEKKQNLIPAREAGELVGYTVDYVSRLARQGRVAGEKIGRHWFVDLDSLKLFSLEAKHEQRKRQEELRMARKAELVTLQKNIFAEERAAATHSYSLIAAGQAAIVTLALALVLMLAWNIHDAKLNMQALSIGAFDVGAALRSIFFVSVPVESGNVPSSDIAQPQVKTETAVRANVPPEQRGMVVFDASVDPAVIEEQFSDEVVVELESERGGVITPVFKNATSTDYRFLMVPVTEAKSGTE